MKYDVELLSKAISEAISHARQFASVDDGGTCNFDACTIPVPGMRESAAEKIQGAHLRNTRWHGRHLQLNGTEGQANRRTAMAEAQREYLKQNYPAIETSMYYQMD